jgi:hypothetical protein
MGLGIAISRNGQPDEELAQASSVEVNERMGEPTTYRIRYEVDISEGDLPFLSDDRLAPGSELAILVPLNNSFHCLVKGPVHGNQIHIEHGGAGSWLEIQGSDTSIAMDRETRSAVWADVKDSDAVLSILADYGYTPDVESTNSTHLETKHTLAQRDSDLRFVQRLARRNGFLFWITCNELGIETAHFKRPPLDGSAAADLVINLKSPSLPSIDIKWDGERPTSVIGMQMDLNNKENIDGAVAKTSQTILGKQSLMDITGDIRSVHLATPVDDSGDLLSRGEGVLIESDWFIHASCQTDLITLGKPVRAHTIAELRGAGSRYSGKYFTAGINHSIDAENHRMNLELVRNGWGA